MIEFDEYKIRKLETKDVSRLFDLIDSNRDRLTAYLPITARENESVEMTRSYIERKKNEARQRTVFTCVIEDQPKQAFVGVMVIKNIDWLTGDCEIGYFIDRGHESLGIISRAVNAVAEHCFSKLRLNKISIVTAPENIGSIRVAEKNGFVKTAKVEDGHTDLDGNKHDVFRYEKLRK